MVSKTPGQVYAPNTKVSNCGQRSKKECKLLSYRMCLKGEIKQRYKRAGMPCRGSLANEQLVATTVEVSKAYAVVLKPVLCRRIKSLESPPISSAVAGITLEN